MKWCGHQSVRTNFKWGRPWHFPDVAGHSADTNFLPHLAPLRYEIPNKSKNFRTGNKCFQCLYSESWISLQSWNSNLKNVHVIRFFFLFMGSSLNTGQFGFTFGCRDVVRSQQALTLRQVSEVAPVFYSRKIFEREGQVNHSLPTPSIPNLCEFLRLRNCRPKNTYRKGWRSMGSTSKLIELVHT